MIKKKELDIPLSNTIHSCDFSSGSFTYIEEGDKDLKTFIIDHDQTYRIPMIKKAIEAAGGAYCFMPVPGVLLPL